MQSTHLTVVDRPEVSRHGLSHLFRRDGGKRHWKINIGREFL
jgi:hypothetical protein